MLRKLINKFTKPPHDLVLLFEHAGHKFYGYTDYKLIHKERADQMRMLMSYELDLGLPHAKLLEYLEDIKRMNDKGERSDIGTVLNNLIIILQNRVSIDNRVRIADKIILLDNEPIEGGAKWLKKKMDLVEKHPQVLFFFVNKSGEFLQHLNILSDGLLKKELILHLKSLENFMTQKIELAKSKSANP